MKEYRRQLLCIAKILQGIYVNKLTYIEYEIAQVLIMHGMLVIVDNKLVLGE